MNPKSKILIVDDEAAIVKSLRGALTDEGYEVTSALSGMQGLHLLEQGPYDLVLLDIWMDELDGIETLQRIRRQWPQIPVIMMSGHGTIETAVRATKLGAFDFVEKPLSLEKLLVLIRNALQARELASENKALRNQIERNRQIIGTSGPIQQIRELIKRVAPTRGSVLITGGNGTGKELIAHSIHAFSPRNDRPFIDVNCAAIPDELIESELFGHEKGAFTGAIKQKKGKFDLADGGTLFLDEIGDMSLRTQAKILRILQEQRFERVGGMDTIGVDVRIIAATNKDLREEIKRGAFREDLYYRLNVIPFVIPSLSERRDDIPLLAEYFLDEACTAYEKPLRKFSADALKLLGHYSWPGNVRELKNLIDRIIILTQEFELKEPISLSTVAQYLEQGSSGTGALDTDPEGGRNDSVGAISDYRNLRDARQQFEKEMILRSLKENGWNVSKTAAALDIERSHLHKKIRTYGIDLEQEKLQTGC